MLVNESLGDILKPKSREEVDKELSKWNKDQKIEGILDTYYDYEDLARDLDAAGADNETFIKTLLKHARNQEKMDLLVDLLSSQEDVVDWLLSYIEPDKMILSDILNQEEEEVLNTLLKNHNKILRNLDHPMDDEEEEGVF